jgi:hypothetical protein
MLKYRIKTFKIDQMNFVWIGGIVKFITLKNSLSQPKKLKIQIVSSILR